MRDHSRFSDVKDIAMSQAPEAAQPHPASAGEAAQEQPVVASKSGWILGPFADLFFVANVLWPVLLLVQFRPGFEGQTGVLFWQLYFITTPHRWITLVIVLLDRNVFRRRKTAFLGLAGFFIAACVGIRLTTGTLTCLLAIDYLWNAWHFSAQHSGIYRIYSRIRPDATPGNVVVEKWLMRSFLLYVIFRTASFASQLGPTGRSLLIADRCFLLIPAWLILRELKTFRAFTIGRSVYLFSVVSLFVSLLGAVHFRQPALVFSLATASAWFHASEYLAVTAWHVQRRAASNEKGSVIAHVARHWGIALTIFVAVLGSCSWLMEHHAVEYWLVINVVVAFLHYAYDGMIWKRGRGKAAFQQIPVVP